MSADLPQVSDGTVSCQVTWNVGQMGQSHMSAGPCVSTGAVSHTCMFICNVHQVGQSHTYVCSSAVCINWDSFMHVCWPRMCVKWDSLTYMYAHMQQASSGTVSDTCNDVCSCASTGTVSCMYVDLECVSNGTVSDTCNDVCSCASTGTVSCMYVDLECVNWDNPSLKCRLTFNLWQLGQSHLQVCQPRIYINWGSPTYRYVDL